MTAPLIFDPALRAARFAHAARRGADDRWLVMRMADELADRLSAVTRPLNDVLLMGQATDRMALSPALACATLTHRPADQPGFAEEALALEPGRYDAILSCATLDTVNDLPGVLSLARRALKPGGLFLAACAGAGSLPAFKALMRAAEEAADSPAVARFHPMIDVRAAGDLLGRAGFTLPVADSDEVIVRYRRFGRLRDDVRGAAMGGMLATRYPLRRSVVAHLAEEVASRIATDGALTEEIALLYLTGWSPET